nr:MAG TPA: hypothetical protein [Caudoviricetes sp.]
MFRTIKFFKNSIKFYFHLTTSLKSHPLLLEYLL